MSKSRPIVAAEFKDAYPAHAVLYLVIKNHGPSVAKDVRVNFTRWERWPTPRWPYTVRGSRWIRWRARRAARRSGPGKPPYWPWRPSLSP